MPEPTNIATRQLAHRLRLVEEARLTAERAGLALRNSIVEAAGAGATQAAIANRAGLSRQRITQILAEERAR